MKRFIYCVVLLASSAYARNKQELFLQANKLYHAHKYEEALAMYNAFNKKGNAIWFNMGNCYYHMGDYARALACWDRSKKGATWHESCDIEANQCLALKKLRRPFNNSLLHALRANTERATEYVSLFSLQLLLLCFMYLFALFGKKMPSGARSVFFKSINGMIIFLLGGLLYIKSNAHTPHGIVTHETPLFVGPNDRYERVATIAHADAVQICAQKDAWCKVRTKNSVGWIPADTLEII